MAFWDNFEELSEVDDEFAKHITRMNPPRYERTYIRVLFDFQELLVFKWVLVISFIGRFIFHFEYQVAD